MVIKRYSVQMTLRRDIFLGILFAAFAAVTFAQPRGAGAIIAIDEAAGGGGVVKGAQGGTGGGVKTSKSGGAQTSTSHNKTSPTTRPPVVSQKNYNGPIVGDKYSFLNFEVAEPVQPVHTNAAKAAGASGLVQVGRSARAIGFLVYRFGKSDDDDDN